MTSLPSVPVCPRCGSPVEARSLGSTRGLFCKSCDWSVVTTHLPDILQDPTSYEIKLSSGDFKNDSHLEVIAQLAGVNLLAARKLLQGPDGFVIFTGHARKVAMARDKLKSVGLEFGIEPSFPW